MRKGWDLRARSVSGSVLVALTLLLGAGCSEEAQSRDAGPEADGGHQLQDAGLAHDAARSGDAAPQADAAQTDDAAGPWTPPPLTERQAPLDGPWRLAARFGQVGGGWGPPVLDEEVQVPGIYYPPWPEGDQTLQLRYERPLEVPAAWRGAPAGDWHVLLELDSVDYRAAVSLGDADLGSHEGYLGRFALDLGGRTQGTLQVVAEDLRQDFDVLESVERKTVQGIDPTAWGINVAGILEPVRLRLVGPLYLRNAFAATLRAGDPARVRLAAELVSLRGGPLDATVGYEIVGPAGEVLAGGEYPAPDVTLQPGEAVAALHDLDLSGLPQGDVLTVRLAARFGERNSDARTASLLNRRVEASGGRLLINGVPTFVKGAGVYFTARLLPKATPEDLPGYEADRALYRQRCEQLAVATREVGASWVRPAHHVPPRPFHQQMLAGGVLVAQDFPLMWATDYQSLPEDEIMRQLDEWIWRVAAEPAVALVSLHNEAEMRQPDPARLERTQRLLGRMITRVRELAPHLVVVGASGGRSTSRFPPDPDYGVDDDVQDVHNYLNSIWSPLFGYRELPWAIERLAQSDGRPVLWSELGAVFTEHFAYLILLTDRIVVDDPPGMTTLRRIVEDNLVVGETRYSLPQLYAAVSCMKYEQVAAGDLSDCMAEQLATRDDAFLIQRARDYFFADRAQADGPADGEPLVTLMHIAASWLAAQMLEARMIWLRGGELAGYFPWDQPGLGYPMSLSTSRDLSQIFGEAADPERWRPGTRALVAAANAPRTLYARTATPGEDVEVFLINDAEETDASVDVAIAGTVLASYPVRLAASAVTPLTVPAALAAQRSGSVAELRLLVGGQQVSRYSLLLP